MKVSDLKPLPASRTTFDKAGCRAIPAVSGCYVICRSDGFIFYIGQAKNLRHRMQQHLANPAKTAKNMQYGTASEFWYLQYPEYKLNMLENTWLQLHKNVHCGALPIFNKIDAPMI